MKHLFKILVVVVMGFGVFHSCSDDKDDDQGTDTIEDLSTLGNDEQFLGFVEKSMSATIILADADEVREILAKEEPLTDEEYTFLATTMGFESLEAMKQYYLDDALVWSEIANRYDFQNQDSDAIAEIYYQVVLGINAKQDEYTEDDCIDNCLDSYYSSIRNEYTLDYLLKTICGSTVPPQVPDQDDPSYPEINQQWIAWMQCYFDVKSRNNASGGLNLFYLENCTLCCNEILYECAYGVLYIPN